MLQLVVLVAALWVFAPGVRAAPRPFVALTESGKFFLLNSTSPQLLGCWEQRPRDPRLVSVFGVLMWVERAGCGIYSVQNFTSFHVDVGVGCITHGLDAITQHEGTPFIVNRSPSSAKFLQVYGGGLYALQFSASFPVNGAESGTMAYCKKQALYPSEKTLYRQNGDGDPYPPAQAKLQAPLDDIQCVAPTGTMIGVSGGHVVSIANDGSFFVGAKLPAGFEAASISADANIYAVATQDGSVTYVSSKNVGDVISVEPLNLGESVKAITGF